MNIRFLPYGATLLALAASVGCGASSHVDDSPDAGGSLGSDAALPDAGISQASDAAVTNPGSNDASGASADGSGSGPACFGVMTSFPVGLVPWDVAVADFNGDHRPDMAVTNSFGDSVSVLLGAGNAAFGAQTQFHTGSEPVGLPSQTSMATATRISRSPTKATTRSISCWAMEAAPSARPRHFRSARAKSSTAPRRSPWGTSTATVIPTSSPPCS